MFNGIVAHVAVIDEWLVERDVTRMAFKWPDPDNLPLLGASVCVNGMCLTVSRREKDRVFFDLSQETLRVTTASSWGIKRRVNVEPALRLGSTIDGHWVSGHVDAVGTVTSMSFTQDSSSLARERAKDQEVTPSEDLALLTRSHATRSHANESISRFDELAVMIPIRLFAYVTPKGGLTIDGVALTVVTVELLESRPDMVLVRFAIIPHTWRHTVMIDYRVGTLVNVEVDMLARYVVAAMTARDNVTANARL